MALSLFFFVCPWFFLCSAQHSASVFWNNAAETWIDISNSLAKSVSCSCTCLNPGGVCVGGVGVGGGGGWKDVMLLTADSSVILSRNNQFMLWVLLT